MAPLSRSTPYFDGGMMGKAAGPNDYQPYGEGGFIKKNGSSEGKYVITTGVWKLSVGDKPVIRLALRDTGSAYAKPAILPHLGINGKIRLELICGKSKKYLDEFSSIILLCYSKKLPQPNETAYILNQLRNVLKTTESISNPGSVQDPAGYDQFLFAV
jgi:hypothetical protein